ncbi:MAG: response regulator [Rhodospirillales bacterium]|nr:response regulator [Rhodospirillales bacterium]
MKKTILVVDDDEDQRELIRAVLEVEGYQVVEAGGGHAALEMMRAEIPDLAIIDIFMPEMDGLETITQIRTRTSDMKIIAMSGCGLFKHADYLSHAKEFGANTGIAKPFKINDLVKLVNLQLA